MAVSLAHAYWSKGVSFLKNIIISEIMEVPFDGSQCKRLLIMEQAEDTNVTQCQQGSPPDQL